MCTLFDTFARTFYDVDVPFDKGPKCSPGTLTCRRFSPWKPSSGKSPECRENPSRDAHFFFAHERLVRSTQHIRHLKKNAYNTRKKPVGDKSHFFPIRFEIFSKLATLLIKMSIEMHQLRRRIKLQYVVEICKRFANVRCDNSAIKILHQCRCS